MCPGMPNNCLAFAEPSSAEWLPTLTSFLPLPLPLLPQNSFPLAAAFILNLVAAAAKVLAKVTHARETLADFFGLKCKSPLSFVAIQATMTYFNHC